MGSLLLHPFLQGLYKLVLGEQRGDEELRLQ